jgi:hypothetical protein
MGFNVDLVAVRGLSPSDTHARLQLQATADTESDPESPVVAASLPSGWHILYFNDRAPPAETELASLSMDAEVLFLDICEMVTTSYAKCWENGNLKWRIAHDCQRGRDDLEVIGDVPSCFQPIADRLRQSQASDDDIDYIFNIPAEVFSNITGFPYDGNPNGYPVDTFVILRRLRPDRKWWQIW